MTHYVTFYSYKGGVGRTMALVNTAFALAKNATNTLGRKPKILIWELDLEAPGLLNLAEFALLQKQVKGGTIDILLNQPPDLSAALKDYVVHHGDTGISLLPAGKLDKNYPKQFVSVNWGQMFEGDKPLGGHILEAIRQQLEKDFTPDFVLIDSRTGLTDIGAICTVQLPDTVEIGRASCRERVSVPV